MLFASKVKGWVLIYFMIIICGKLFQHAWLLTGIHENVMQSNLFNMGTKGAIESVHIDGMSVLSSLNLERAFFPPGQSKVSVIIRFLY